MSTVAFPITAFLAADGTPLSDGRATIRLSADAVSPSGQQLFSRMLTPVTLNNSGEPTASINVWPNSLLDPNDTVYVVNSYSQNGELVTDSATVTATSS